MSILLAFFVTEVCFGAKENALRLPKMFFLYAN